MTKRFAPHNGARKYLITNNMAIVVLSQEVFPKVYHPKQNIIASILENYSSQNRGHYAGPAIIASRAHASCPHILVADPLPRATCVTWTHEVSLCPPPM
jgi:hypothetical protein